MKFLHRALVALALTGAFAFGTPALAADAPKKAEAKDLVLKGDAKCTACHEEEDSPQQLAIGKTRHGTNADQRAPTCSSCHGESPTHITKPAGSSDRPGVEVNFGAKSKTSVEDRNGKCLACHQGGKRIHWQSGVHASRDVACTSCHKVHTAKDTVRAKETQSEVCFTCHKEQRTQVNRPSHHPIPEGKMTCSSCHDIHGDNPKMMVRQTVNETCYTCHMEKRGPFVHNHQPVTEDCSICHNPHGTVVANLLKSRPPFLCQECHNHTGHPGQVATVPASRAALGTGTLGTVGRGCVNCHTNIHGSNSTQNSATAGRFRR